MRRKEVTELQRINEKWQKKMGQLKEPLKEMEKESHSNRVRLAGEEKSFSCLEQEDSFKKEPFPKEEHLRKGETV